MSLNATIQPEPRRSQSRPAWLDEVIEVEVGKYAHQVHPPVRAHQHLKSTVMEAVVAEDRAIATREQVRRRGILARVIVALIAVVTVIITAPYAAQVVFNGADILALTGIAGFLWAVWPAMNRDAWSSQIDDTHPESLGSLDMLEREGRL